METTLGIWFVFLQKQDVQERSKRTRSSSENSDLEFRPKRKMSKFDSLKPISRYLETLLVSHGLTQQKADLVVFDITERFVTAGFGWDKILQCHAKVKQCSTNLELGNIFFF